MRARVDADVQSLGDIRVAPAAFLRRAARIHPKELAPGTFGLGFEDRGELRPRGVVYLLGKTHARQPFDVEILHGDRIEALDDVERCLVLEVEANALHGGEPEYETYVTPAWPTLADEFEYERDGLDDPYAELHRCDPCNDRPWSSPITQGELEALEREEKHYRERVKGEPRRKV